MSNEKTTRKSARAARGTKEGYWRMVYVGPRGNKRQVLKAPDGRVFEGTRAEIVQQRMTPYERRSLASSLRILHSALKGESLRECAAGNRREKLREHFIYTLSSPFRRTNALDIMLDASARYMERSAEELKDEALMSTIESTIDLALHDGKGELPLTRHEKAALAELGFTQEDFSPLLKLRRVLAEAR